MYLVVTSVTWYVTLIASGFALLRTESYCDFTNKCKVSNVGIEKPMFCVPIPIPRTRQRETGDISPRNKGGNVHVFGSSRSLHLSAFTSRTTNPASNSPTSCLRFASSPPAVSCALHRLICPWCPY